MLIAGNWKMNTTVPEAQALARGIATGYTNALDPIDILVCPPAINIPAVVDALADSSVAVGGQDMHEAENGAFTGELGAPMLTAAGCTYVILGHSERRQLFGLTDDALNAQVKQAQSHDLIPVVCVGETKAQRDAGDAKSVVSNQLHAALEGATVTGDTLVIAYEPVWAIGTGDSATPEQAQAMHAFVRGELADLNTETAAADIYILYGGSMKPRNAEELLGQADVDGGLIGGASLSADSFLEIARIGAAEVAA